MLRLKKGFIFAIILISLKMLTGNNARQKKRMFCLRPGEDEDLSVSSAAILGRPSLLLLSSKLIIQLFYLAVCHLTQVLRVCLREEKNKTKLITARQMQATNKQNAVTLSQ